MPGVARFIETVSLQAVAFGVGIVADGAILVSPRIAAGASSVPGRTLEISGVVSGNDEGSLGLVFPFRIQLLEFSGLPTGMVGAAVPVALPRFVVEIVPKAAADVAALGAVVGAQLITVPGVVGSDASGTGARLVSAAPGSVAAENGLGPLSGEETIVPGVVGSPIDVVPMVETCARTASQPNSDSIKTPNSRIIATFPFLLTPPACGPSPSDLPPDSPSDSAPPGRRP